MQIWRDAQQKATETRAATFQQRYDQRARDCGYGNLQDMLAKTWTLTDLTFGEMFGVSESMAGHLRATYGDRPDTEKYGPARRGLQYVRAINRRYDERAQAAGYKGITDMLHRTRSLMNRELADLLGISKQAASRLRIDPSMARLRPGDGSPIKPTAQLQKRRAASKARTLDMR